MSKMRTACSECNKRREYPSEEWYRVAQHGADGNASMGSYVGIIRQLCASCWADHAALRAQLRQAEQTRDELAEALDLAMKGCGSAIWILNNTHNTHLEQWHEMAMTAKADARHGYDAADAALERARKGASDAET